MNKSTNLVKYRGSQRTVSGRFHQQDFSDEDEMNGWFPMVGSVSCVSLRSDHFFKAIIPRIIECCSSGLLLIFIWMLHICSCASENIRQSWITHSEPVIISVFSDCNDTLVAYKVWFPPIRSMFRTATAFLIN